jgi:hypothetical protein
LSPPLLCPLPFCFFICSSLILWPDHIHLLL